MQPEDVARSYDKIAARWSGPEFNRDNGIAPHRRALAFCEQRGAALDAGCGSSGRFIDLLSDAGFAVEGLDLSAEMLRLARQRHPSVLFHQADVRLWEPKRAYDFISGWDSIWHVPVEDQAAVLRKLCGALSEGGVFIFTAGGLEEAGGKVDAAMGVPMYHATLGVTRILQELEAARCRLRHFEFDQYPELHVYFIAQRM